MEKPTLNEDEMIGFIMRRAFEEEGVSLSYDGVRITMNTFAEYLMKDGVIEEADTAER